MPATKKNIRLGKEIRPAGTVVRTYTVTVKGQVFTVGDPMNGEKSSGFTATHKSSVLTTRSNYYERSA